VRSLRPDTLSAFLTERLGKRKLGEVSEAELAALINHAAEREKSYALFIHPLHDLITDAKLGEGPHTVLRGAPGLLIAAGDDSDILARAVAFLENRKKIEKTLDNVAGNDEIRVLIGGDGASAMDPMLDGFALVVSGYHVHARARGRLGILGPMRMPYGRHLGLVKSLSDLISRVLISRELSPGQILSI